ncbi:MAG: hypothetical protein RL662_1480 [Bacteroidota bacterium]|jgi:hypothetical protein
MILYMSLVRKSILFIIFILCSFSSFNCYSQQKEIEKVFSDFETIESDGRYVDDLTNIDDKVYNLPIGIKKIVSNMPLTIAISNVKLGSQFAEASVYVKLEMPSQSTDKKSKYLIFGAVGVKMSYNGDFIENVKLVLISSHTLTLGKMGDVTFRGGHVDNSSGNISSDTYIMLDCNGDFKELSIDADLTLNKNTFTPAVESQGTPVTSNFKIVVHDLNDLLVSLSIPSFTIKGIPDLVFEVSEATLDLSDFKNSPSFNPDVAYFQTYFTLPDERLWRGLYINKFSVKLPSMFNTKNNLPTKIEASRLLIDEVGITGDIIGENVLPFEQGDASGCSFSVTDFRLTLLANNIKGLGFGGQIGIPILKDEKPRTYKAYISKNEYLFNVSLDEEKELDLGFAKLSLLPTSIMQVAVIDGRFAPRVILDGSMKVDAEGLNIEQLAFTKLSLSTVAPHFDVESVKHGGDVKFQDFPISISNIELTAKNDVAVLGFDMKLNLMENKISASSHLALISEIKNDAWRFRELQVDALKLDKVKLAGFSLDGEIRLGKDDPVYGNHFGGQIVATFGSLSDEMKVSVASIFGSTDFRYWYVEGQADFKMGIPIGPVLINGFVGGAYYKMLAKGGSFGGYVPNKDSSLGLKAGIAYSIMTEAVSGDALFETNFLSTGGIRDMRFYGSAEFMTPVNMTNKLGRLDNMYKTAQDKVKNLGDSYTQGLPKAMNGSEIAKRLLPDLALNASIKGYLSMDYQFVSKTFDANFSVMVSTPGNILRGAGSNGEAGWGHLHCSPSTWFVHLGTPSNPIGLKMGLGPLSLSTESYFMLGDKLESPTLDYNVSRILGISAKDADYMKFPENMALGKGVAFGSRFKFDTGDLRFLILYARFMAGAGFDVMLQDLSDYKCRGQNDPIGIDGWYANGQCYAYLQGELGVNVRLLFIKKKIAIIKGSTAALLQARLPNPTWIGGYMAVRLQVLGGLINSNMKMKFSFGDACELVRNDDDYTPLDFPIIADLTPRQKETDVDVFLSPQATFNMELEKPFETEDDRGNTHTYRVKLEDFYIKNTKGEQVTGKVKKTKGMDASFEAFEILPPNTDLEVVVSVNFEEFANGSWKLVTNEGKPARETKKVSFTTGTAPNHIPLSNIEYSYPVIGQQNFFQGESNQGYVQLKKGQQYLFPENFVYQTAFANNGNQDLKTDFNYNASNKMLSYTLPTLSNRTGYEISFVAATQAVSSQSQTTPLKTSTTVGGGDDEAFSVDYMQQAAQKIIKDGHLKVLNYTFRSSNFNTFEQKMSSLSLNKGAMLVDSDVRVLFLKTDRGMELFDEAELQGNDYTTGHALVVAEAMLDDSYYKNDIAPLLYNWYPMNGISIQNRDTDLLGVPPSKAFSLFDGYLGGSPEMSKVFPLVYQVPYYYSRDFYELRNKAANMFDRGVNMSPLLPLIRSQFPVIDKGDYKTRLRYTMPGGKQGTEKLINYIYW